MNRREAMQATAAAAIGAVLPAITPEPVAAEMTFRLSDFPRLKEIPGWTAGVDQALMCVDGAYRWVRCEECA
jgi:hypothetical protein